MNQSFCLAVEANGAVSAIEYSIALARHNEGQATTWIHIFDTDAQKSAAMLLKDFGFHPVAVEDAVGRDERPELKEFEDHLFMVAPALVGKQDGEEVFDEVGMFIKGNTLVSITHHEVPALIALSERWCSKRSVSIPRVGYLAYSLLDAILDGYFPCLDAIEDEVDAVSDCVYQGDTHRMRELLVLKRRMLHLRRTLGPFRDVMNSLVRRDVSFVDGKLEAYFHDLYDTTLRLTELVDTNRDALTGVLDIHLSTVSNNLNEVMKKMTVISTILMTAALIAGIYGMNFKHMP
ncbi:MAG TPA: magnesium/cobalt transporter CorA, partial [Fimbriimonas sp.]|nr:magnesium/cobalt transporter CorA [Fimbriimonas sp.]